MTFDDALESVLAQSAANRFILENVVLPTLRQTSPEAFKRHLDAEAERCEAVVQAHQAGDVVSRQERIFGQAAQNALAILRTAFDRQ
jgi:hypothetical protein